MAESLGTPRSLHVPSSQHDADEATHIYPLDLPIGSGCHPVQSVNRFLFFVATKKMSHEESASCLRGGKANKKKNFTQVDPSSVQLEV